MVTCWPDRASLQIPSVPRVVCSPRCGRPPTAVGGLSHSNLGQGSHSNRAVSCWLGDWRGTGATIDDRRERPTLGAPVAQNLVVSAKLAPLKRTTRSPAPPTRSHGIGHDVPLQQLRVAVARDRRRARRGDGAVRDHQRGRCQAFDARRTAATRDASAKIVPDRATSTFESARRSNQPDGRVAATPRTRAG